MIDSYENIIIELFSMDFPNYHHCITNGNYYNYGISAKEQSPHDYLIVDEVSINKEVLILSVYIHFVEFDK